MTSKVADNQYGRLS